MQEHREIIDHYTSLNVNEKIEFIRDFDEVLSYKLALFFSELVQDKAEDELLRIEILKIIGIYKGNYNYDEIKKNIFKIITQDDESYEVRVYAIEAISSMSITDDDIVLFADILNSEQYILVKEAAFSLVVLNKSLPSANLVLKNLLNDPRFGKSALRELQ